MIFVTPKKKHISNFYIVRLQASRKHSKKIYVTNTPTDGILRIVD
jgi:hypothetical protein